MFRSEDETLVGKGGRDGFTGQRKWHQAEHRSGLKARSDRKHSMEGSGGSLTKGFEIRGEGIIQSEGCEHPLLSLWVREIEELTRQKEEEMKGLNRPRKATTSRLHWGKTRISGKSGSVPKSVSKIPSFFAGTKVRDDLAKFSLILEEAQLQR
ncbi:hypothetical protein K2173_010145 (mitochondrion) [Erythroxylum novogranatense]|uniref:Uncharacterized protein n=1 Tax=Erythroxylum novogranatense TaxID=1862640 RepID=A0AAV8S490_9ROSI|nr:hypothetical protein K2173_010145 [Erythroxylum novogranatense]